MNRTTIMKVSYLTIRVLLATRHALFSVIFGQGPEGPSQALSIHYVIKQALIILHGIVWSAVKSESGIRTNFVKVLENKENNQISS